MFLGIYTLFSLFAVLMHPLHMSVTNVEIVDNKAQVFTRLFKDDLALAMKHKHNMEINWLDAQEWLTYEENVCNYVMASVLVHSKGEKAQVVSKPTLQVQKETIEITWALLLKSSQNFKINNFLLLDSYPDQKNMVIIHQNNSELGISFNHHKTSVTISNDKIVN